MVYEQHLLWKCTVSDKLLLLGLFLLYLFFPSWQTFQKQHIMEAVCWYDVDKFQNFPLVKSEGCNNVSSMHQSAGNPCSQKCALTLIYCSALPLAKLDRNQEDPHHQSTSVKLPESNFQVMIQERLTSIRFFMGHSRDKITVALH